MNRKERRAAQKQGKGPLGPGPSPAPVTTSLFAAAFQHFRAGQSAEAERLCRDVLTIDRNHFDSLHLLGIIALRAGRHEAAVELLDRAVAADGRSPECRVNLAQALRALGRLEPAAAQLTQAIALRPDYGAAHRGLADVLAQQGKIDESRRHYERALALDPNFLEARYGLANLCLQQGRLDDAVSHYRRILAARPDAAEAHSNLGVALAAQDKWDEAAAQYQRALALKPKLVDVYRNLGRLLLARGDAAQALALARRGLSIQETEETRSFFVQCAKALPSMPADDAARDDLRSLLARALAEGWTRPGELSAPAASLLKSSDIGRDAIERVTTAWPRRLSAPELWGPDGLAAVSRDRLLRALLESAPVQDVELERLLTSARFALLEQAAGSEASSAIAAEAIGFYGALAQQCFINEYVFACTADEARQAAELAQRLGATLGSNASVPPLWPIAVAAYVPLHSLACADLLPAKRWPDPIPALLDQQVHKPMQERQIRASIPALTAIRDEVSLAVRRQYEDMPYPRWVKAAPVGKPAAIGWYLRNQFPAAALHEPGQRNTLEVLIAGCGTGQHAIETSQRFAGARLLAIDLSLTSLSYAERKTRELGLRNIDYAQADILELGSIGRSFDLIEASGVLHHLGDPAAGWRVLLPLLRPGGFMHIGLYSALARQDVLAARKFIADRGYGQTIEDIRQCRQELMSFEDGHPLKDVADYSDFFTTSECRDLIFHAQEHQLTIPEIKSFLQENDLHFIGFTGQAAQLYRRRFPEDKAMADLDRWHLVENENPKAFVNMYQFWIQKPAR